MKDWLPFFLALPHHCGRSVELRGLSPALQPGVVVLNFIGVANLTSGSRRVSYPSESRNDITPEPRLTWQRRTHWHSLRGRSVSSWVRYISDVRRIARLGARTGLQIINVGGAYILCASVLARRGALLLMRSLCVVLMSRGRWTYDR